MSQSDILFELDSLLQKLCDDHLSASEKEQLLRILHGSAAARSRYIEFIALSVSLAEWSHGKFAPCDIDIECADAVDHGDRADGRQTVTPITLRERKTRSQRTWGLALAASMLVALGVIALDHWPHRQWRPRQSVQAAASPEVVAPQVRLAGHQEFVARVVEVTHDTNWDVDAMPQEFLMRLKSGEQLNLLSGLAMIEFYSGAQLILHGPAKFQLTGAAAGVLSEGRVTVRVDVGDFLLTTPSAEVLDLGTEFGVSVDPDSGTDVLVFDGEVEVRSESTDPRDLRETVNLTQGMTVRVDEGGKLGGESLLTVDRFSRRFAGLSQPSSAATELSVVDILCGGSGKGQRLAAAIDPLTGDWDRVGWQTSSSPGSRHGDVVFHSSSWHPLIDGTFIPSNAGKLTQLDSQRREFVFPGNLEGKCWGPVWARRYSKDLKVAKRTKDIDFWGAETFPVVSDRLADSRHGGIGLHANVGITFDLHGIRTLNGAQIESFSAVLTNLDNADTHNPEYAKNNVRSADVWVIVDGEVRYQRLGFERNVAGVPFEVPILPADQKLTLVTTDAGNSNKYDHIVLIDPVLKLHPGQKALRWDRDSSRLASTHR